MNQQNKEPWVIISVFSVESNQIVSCSIMGLNRVFCTFDKELWKLCVVLLTWKSMKSALGLTTTLCKFFSDLTFFTLLVSQFLSFTRESLFSIIFENYVNMKTGYNLSEQWITRASLLFEQIFSKIWRFIKVK